jgi:hypothetical protein
MFACDFFESADPVFAYIQQQRYRLPSRPYAGYLLFFFGESDTEIATWFARNIVALDSLTESSLAGLVFARKIRIQAQRIVETPPASRRRSTSSRLTNSAHVSDSMIRRVDHPRQPFDNRLMPDFKIRGMVSADGTQAVYPEEEIGAITYGSDEVAAQFGVLADMPCIVLLNAVPTGTVEIIRLSDYDPVTNRRFRNALALSSPAIPRQAQTFSATACGDTYLGLRTIQHWEKGDRTPPPYLNRALKDISRELLELASPKPR